MLKVYPPKDIRSYETKFLGPFTKRECICLTAIIIEALIFGPILAMFNIDIIYKCFIFLVLIIPAILFGWYKPQGIPFETYLTRIVYLQFLTPKRRRYDEENEIRRLTGQSRETPPKKIKYDKNAKRY